MHETLRQGNIKRQALQFYEVDKIIAKKLNVIRILKYTANFPSD